MNILRQRFLITFGLLIFIILVFISAYSLGKHFSYASVIDELDWLKKEFKLSSVEIEKIRKLHNGYRPICEKMCKNIAQKKIELDNAISNSTNVTPEIERLIIELGQYRAKCQVNMIRHFYEVSSKMPPAQGKRYFENMKELTLGAHERIEQSMSAPSRSDTNHHH